MNKFKVHNDGVLGLDKAQILYIYKYGIVFKDQSEIHVSQYFLRDYVKRNKLEHLVLQ